MISVYLDVNNQLSTGGNTWLICLACFANVLAQKFCPLPLLVVVPVCRFVVAHNYSHVTEQIGLCCLLSSPSMNRHISQGRQSVEYRHGDTLFPGESFSHNAAESFPPSALFGVSTGNRDSIKTQTYHPWSTLHLEASALSDYAVCHGFPALMFKRLNGFWF